VGDHFKQQATLLYTIAHILH